MRIKHAPIAILLFTTIEHALLFWQVQNVTDDGSSSNVHAGPEFYWLSYLCIGPTFLFYVI